MFEIYSIILKGNSNLNFKSGSGTKGVTYKDIDNKVKIGIVSVSHYCCRLKKMNFVELRHQKNQKVVYPKDMVSIQNGRSNISTGNNNSNVNKQKV